MFELIRSSSDEIVIGGFSPFDQLIFPGHLSAVIYLQGCTWQCAYCHSPQFRAAHAAVDYDWAKVKNFLLSRRHILDAVVLTGGEPLLQKSLVDMCGEIKHMGFKVVLHTSGAVASRLQKVLPLLDWVELDIKAIPEHYSELTDNMSSAREAYRSLLHLLNSGVEYEVRTTVHSEIMGRHELKRLANLLASMGVTRFKVQSAKGGGDAKSLAENEFQISEYGKYWWRLERMFEQFSVANH